jgi:hypothetical protein
VSRYFALSSSWYFLDFCVRVQRPELRERHAGSLRKKRWRL